MSELAPEAMQRMVGVRDRDKAQPHQRIAKEAGRHARADRDVHIAPQKRFIGAAEHRFVELDSRLGTLLRESRQALQQQPGREDDLDGEAHFRLPVGGHGPCASLERDGFLDQGACPPVEHLPGLGQDGLAATDLEGVHAEQRLDLLHRVCDG